MRRFAYTLALALRYPSPDRLLVELTEAEFWGWLQFYYFSPFGDLRDDLRTAQHIASQCTKSINVFDITLQKFFEDRGVDPVAEGDAADVIDYMKGQGFTFDDGGQRS